MKTEFLVITGKGTHEVTGKSIGTVIATDVHQRAAVQLASSTETSRDGVSLTYFGTTRPAEDRDLFLAWHHATIARKHGVYATKELLRQELIDRGYTLNEKNRWYKLDVENPE